MTKKCKCKQSKNQNQMNEYMGKSMDMIMDVTALGVTLNVSKSILVSFPKI